MANYQTGLETVFANKAKTLASQASTQGAVDVVIAERRHFHLTQLSFFPTQLAALKKELAHFGISDVPHFSQFKKGKKAHAARVEMDKIWLISDAPLAIGNKALYPLDLSSARNCVRLSGARAADVMARLCAVDFRDKSRVFFATSIHHVGVHIHYHDDCFDIYMPRSFSASLSDLIIDIARQYHVQMA